KIQPFLYMAMLRHHLRRILGPSADVEFFGYFFPGHKAKGTRIAWSTQDLESGRSVVSDLLRIASEGLFIATNDDGDCRFCDYRRICSSPQQVTGITSEILEGPDSDRLASFKRLREASQVRD
ncbi:MAG: PD-(D/E)XK nuclease family protein, partial [Verrucomicrobiales bacterium]